MISKLFMTVFADIKYIYYIILLNITYLGPYNTIPTTVCSSALYIIQVRIISFCYLEMSLRLLCKKKRIKTNFSKSIFFSSPEYVYFYNKSRISPSAFIFIYLYYVYTIAPQRSATLRNKNNYFRCTYAYHISR